jgi:hypothetical protein
MQGSEKINFKINTRIVNNICVSDPLYRCSNKYFHSDEFIFSIQWYTVSSKPIESLL